MQQEGEFFDLDKADYGLVPVHCDVWAGFIFVNLDREPRQSLREFLGPMVTAIEGYPFDRLTERYAFRADVPANWKIFMDALQEQYHTPIVHSNQRPETLRRADADTASRRRTTSSTVRTACSTRPASDPWKLPDDQIKPSERLLRSGLFGPGRRRLHPATAARRHQPGGHEPWGVSLFEIFPELRHPVLGARLVPHVPPLADVVQHPHLRVQPVLRAARERRASESRAR